MSITISKITRAGQITLPKKIRDNKAFAGAQAVSFEERGGEEIVIKPLKVQKRQRTVNDHWPIVVHTTQGWLDEVNDDLVK